MIYILHSLTTNEAINWINLKDNYFSHEIDFVILNFLEKNTHLTHIDLTKNRFSFQCLQKVNKIIKRNRNIQNNKEPNKLLVELYSLKYENTKLNELRETLKIIENDNAKLKLNKIDLRQDYELAKKEKNEKMVKTLKEIESNQKKLELRKKELQEKTMLLETKKLDNQKRVADLQLEYENLIKEKEQALELNEKIKQDTDNLQKEMTEKIVALNDDISKNTEEEGNVMKKVRELALKIVNLEEKIKNREEELKKQGLELKKVEEEKKEDELKQNVLQDKKEVIEEKKDDKKDNKKDEKKKKGKRSKSKKK